MDLSASTPREIDTRLADLEVRQWEHRAKAYGLIDLFHSAAADKSDWHGRRRVWRMTDADAIAQARVRVQDHTPGNLISHGGPGRVAGHLADYDANLAAADALQPQIDELDAEYDRRPWTRFFQLRSTPGAKIHATRWCGALHRSNHGDLGWHPELSGKTEAEAVAELGPTMCSRKSCFPSAPVEWRRDPTDLKDDPDRCPGSGQVADNLQTRYVSPRGNCPTCGKPVTPTRTGRTPKHKKPK